MTLAMFKNVSRREAVLTEMPISLAYEGRYTPGRYAARACQTVAVASSQNNGFLKNPYDILTWEIFFSYGKRGWLHSTDPPSRIPDTTPHPSIVERDPYFSRRTEQMGGNTTPAPVDTPKLASSAFIFLMKYIQKIRTISHTQNCVACQTIPPKGLPKGQKEVRFQYPEAHLAS